MSGLAVWTSPAYGDDELFNPDSPLNRDECLTPLRALAQRLQSRNWAVHSQDVWQRRGEQPTAVLFLDRPRGSLGSVLGSWHGAVQSYLLLRECEVVLPRNWDLARHRDYASVFTWKDDLLEGERYERVCFAQEIDVPPESLPVGDRLVTLIAANKRARHPCELYSKRVEAIRWFERWRPDDFDLYGVGWDRRAIGNSIASRIARRMKFPDRLVAPRYPSYRGTVQAKRSTLQRYRFAICFENAHSIPGYITEKIFDCFMAGCVPIYWGAPNVRDHIPADCFIDFRDFMDFGKVYDHMSRIGENKILGYRQRIRSFLRSPRVAPYTIEHFSETIARRLLADA